MNDIFVSVDLRSAFGPVRNQGPRPTCLAFAASDSHAGVRTGWTPLSCEYVFYHAQRRAGRPPSTGALLISTLDTLREDGQPEEVGWPYLAATPSDPASWMPPANVGTLFGRAGVMAHASIGQIVKELDEGRPVIVLLTLSQAFYAPSAQGVIYPAEGEKPQPERRHAVIAVGYGSVDSHRAVLIRNSWGAQWGERGYGWLTEPFLEPRLFGAAKLTEEVNVSTSSITA